MNKALNIDLDELRIECGINAIRQTESSKYCKDAVVKLIDWLYFKGGGGGTDDCYKLSIFDSRPID